MFKQLKKCKKRQNQHDGIELMVLNRKKNINNISYINDKMPIVKQNNHQTTKDIIAIDISLYDNIKNNCNVVHCEKCDLDYSTNRIKKLKKYIAILKELQKIPLIKQRTPEWFDARKSRLTASELEDAIKDKSLRLAKKKAGISNDSINYNAIPALKWGTMFESMAIRCYTQYLNDIKVIEFGLVLDKNHSHFGASPDGINEMGIMIEIKCPYSRAIKDGYIPSKYYMQMQGQLAVCELEECDYIECKFVTFESVYKYIDEINLVENNSLKNHGIIAEYQNIHNSEYHYLYSKSYLTASKALDDINKQTYDFQDGNFRFLKYTPWRMENMNIQRVYFDETLWTNTLVKITKFWENVEECIKNPIIEDKKKPIKKVQFINDDD